MLDMETTTITGEWACTKCGGDGRYWHADHSAGACYACDGTGYVKAAPVLRVVRTPDECRALLRALYVKTRAAVSREDAHFAEDYRDEFKSLGWDLLAHGDLETTERAVKAFEALGDTGREMTRTFWFHATCAPTWQRLPGNVQRAVLAHSGRDVVTVYRGRKSINVKPT